MLIQWVADTFKEFYMGGAEFSDDALIRATDRPVVKVFAKDLSIEYLKAHANDYFIFGNFTECKPSVIEYAASTVKCSVIEYDFKLCAHRCPIRHKYITGTACLCCVDHVKKLFLKADHVFFMSEKQKRWADEGVPGFKGVVLSAPFSAEELTELRSIERAKDRNGWIILYSPGWVKGAREAVKYAVQNGIDYRLLDKPKSLWSEFAKAEGFIAMPAGNDTCPRAVTEAKILGCKLILNENVLQKDEPWFKTDDIESILKYLEGIPGRFWDIIEGKN